MKKKYLPLSLIAFLMLVSSCGSNTSSGEEASIDTEPPVTTTTERPTVDPTIKPTEVPTEAPTEVPTEVSTETPTETPTEPEVIPPSFEEFIFENPYKYDMEYNEVELKGLTGFCVNAASLYRSINPHNHKIIKINQAVSNAGVLKYYKESTLNLNNRIVEVIDKRVDNNDEENAQIVTNKVFYEPSLNQFVNTYSNGKEAKEYILFDGIDNEFQFLDTVERSLCYSAIDGSIQAEQLEITMGLDLLMNKAFNMLEIEGSLGSDYGDYYLNIMFDPKIDGTSTRYQFLFNQTTLVKHSFINYMNGVPVNGTFLSIEETDVVPNIEDISDFKNVSQDIEKVEVTKDEFNKYISNDVLKGFDPATLKYPPIYRNRYELYTEDLLTHKVLGRANQYVTLKEKTLQAHVYTRSESYDTDGTTQLNDLSHYLYKDTETNELYLDEYNLGSEELTKVKNPNNLDTISLFANELMSLLKEEHLIPISYDYYAEQAKIVETIGLLFIDSNGTNLNQKITKDKFNNYEGQILKENGGSILFRISNNQVKYFEITNIDQNIKSVIRYSFDLDCILNDLVFIF